MSDRPRVLLDVDGVLNVIDDLTPTELVDASGLHDYRVTS